MRKIHFASVICKMCSYQSSGKEAFSASYKSLLIEVYYMCCSFFVNGIECVNTSNLNQ